MKKCMCGIVGYIGKNRALPILLDGLRRLEYRGYDSSGIVICDDIFHDFRVVGKIKELDKKIANMSLGGNIRVVHNGIIENHSALRKQLERKGHIFKSQTDTEVVPHLLEDLYKGNITETLKDVLRIIKGTYGLAVLCAQEPEKILVARKGSPLVIGIGKDETIIASDVSAILQYTKEVIYLEDGEMAEIYADHFKIFDSAANEVDKNIERIEGDIDEATKKGFDHFMLKEIFEQPSTITDSIRGRVVMDEGKVKLGGLEICVDKLRGIKRIIIIACGTAWHAGLIGEYMIEEYAGIPVEVEWASEFRYRKPILDKKTAVLVISQSGETADTLAALREAREKGALTLGIVNTVGSTIARETDAGVYNHIGPEISVAS